MWRIRFHGRGGQGMKTASRILGTTFFLAGYEVQDSPRYGAERRGAPMTAYVRAGREPIFERGIITHPDLIVVADRSLLSLPLAGVFQGLTKDTVLLILTEDTEQNLHIPATAVKAVLALPLSLTTDGAMSRTRESSACAAAAAALLSLPLPLLLQSLQEELHKTASELLQQNLTGAKAAYERMFKHQNLVRQSSVNPEAGYEPPHWIDLQFEDAHHSAPAIHGEATSLLVKTGAWRSMRPVIDIARCNRCGLCHTFCPDGVISLSNEGVPEIDYDHCKGCMICKVQCPMHAIDVQTEHGGTE
ncbi:MAG: 2-oxoacid:acceptor oxidoreductase family protein [Proteobacteria bacterium]|nr:2-oxoacid:acceptor oxidoreductase family protein [Pseudomonadota bacterium]